VQRNTDKQYSINGVIIVYGKTYDENSFTLYLIFGKCVHNLSLLRNMSLSLHLHVAINIYNRILFCLLKEKRVLLLFRLDYGSQTMDEVIHKLDLLLDSESSVDATSKVPTVIWKILGNEKVSLRVPGLTLYIVWYNI